MQPAPDGVRVTCRRVPLEPGILLTHGQWSQLAVRLAAGDLPDFAVELPDSWVTKIAPPGQERNALYLWRDEVAALAHEVRAGRYAHCYPATESDPGESSGQRPTPGSARSTTMAVAAPPSRTRVGAQGYSSPSTALVEAACGEAEAAVGLTLAQFDLLIAMAAPACARIVGGVVRVASRIHSIRDLYTLRTAKLVRPCRDGRGLRERRRFEISDHGMAEARRRAITCAGTAPTCGRT
jgi:hypothetical protein